jgi:indole-3-glycerol phosphate synthase
MATYLAAIVAAHRRRAAADTRPLDGLLSAALATPAPRGFRSALERQAARGSGVIAEIKRRSPSKGALAPDLDPAAVAAEYASGGASCLSVLTDEDAFGGSPEDLGAARRAVSLPVLRKDFTVDPRDLCDARLMGADAALLIVAALSDAELASFCDLGRTLGLDLLVEVHDETELSRALALDATLIGVNQRDLATFEVDRDRARSLAERMPPHVVAVAESGIRDARDVASLASCGYAAVLVGESLVTAPDRAAATAALVGHPVRARLGGAVR